MKILLLAVLLTVSNAVSAECSRSDYSPYIIKSAIQVDKIYSALHLGAINMTIEEFIQQQQDQLAIINKDLKFLKCGK